MSGKIDGFSFRSRLVEVLIKKAELKGLPIDRPDAMRVVGSFFDVVLDALRRGESVDVPNFGRFEVIGEAGSRTVNLIPDRSILAILEAE